MILEANNSLHRASAPWVIRIEFLVGSGANSFRLGSALFKPSYDLAELQKRANAYVAAPNRCNLQ